MDRKHMPHTIEGAFGQDLDRLRKALGAPSQGEHAKILRRFAALVGSDTRGMNIMDGKLTTDDFRAIGDALGIPGLGQMDPGTHANVLELVRTMTRMASLKNFLGDSGAAFNGLISSFLAEHRGTQAADWGKVLLSAMLTGDGSVGEALQEVMKMFSDKDEFMERTPHLYCVVRNTPLEHVVHACVNNLKEVGDDM